MNSGAFSQVDAKFQVEFIAYLQRLLVEGDFVATYKFALLHALADICIERPLNNVPGFDSGESASNSKADNIITIDELVEKFIELYWQHSLPYSGNDDQTFVLKQNNGIYQAAIISELKKFRARGVKTVAQLRALRGWTGLCNRTRITFEKGPLWRLQLLAGNEECFLYPHLDNGSDIKLNHGVAFCFRRFHDLVVSLARSHWTQKVCNIPANQKVIGGQGNLSDFLFGSDRRAIIQARPLLLQIQHGNCFYCQKPLKETGEVDHFIPWARYPNDLGHNFVLAHSKCNKSKSDHLAAEKHKDRWFEQNIIKHEKIITSELDTFFVCESGRSEAIATWAYQLAAQNSSPLWLKGKEFEQFGQTDKGHFV